MPGRAMNPYASGAAAGRLGRAWSVPDRRVEDLRGAFLGTRTTTWDDAMSCDRDLEAMVHDFIENEASGGGVDGGDGDDAGDGAMTLAERLQVCVKAQSAHERELLGDVQRVLLGADEARDLICGVDCKAGACIRRFVVKRLKLASWGAAVCRSAWAPAPGRIPGGEYEYIEVVARGPERLIVDVSFQAQFEIARPTAEYSSALQSLPTVFVGAAGKLEQVLRIMSDAARASLEQSDMHLPPWRTLQYMRSKWLSAFTTPSAPAPPCNGVPAANAAATSSAAPNSPSSPPNPDLQQQQQLEGEALAREQFPLFCRDNASKTSRKPIEMKHFGYYNDTYWIPLEIQNI